MKPADLKSMKTLSSPDHHHLIRDLKNWFHDIVAGVFFFFFFIEGSTISPCSLPIKKRGLIKRWGRVNCVLYYLRAPTLFPFNISFLFLLLPLCTFMLCFLRCEIRQEGPYIFTVRMIYGLKNIVKGITDFVRCKKLTIGWWNRRRWSKCWWRWLRSNPCRWSIPIPFFFYPIIVGSQIRIGFLIVDNCWTLIGCRKENSNSTDPVFSLHFNGFEFC